VGDLGIYPLCVLCISVVQYQLQRQLCILRISVVQHSPFKGFRL